jgi:hypothetical protein
LQRVSLMPAQLPRRRFAELCEVVNASLDIPSSYLIDVFDGTQFEDDCLAHVAVSVRRFLVVMGFIDDLSFKGRAGSRLCEQQKRSAISGMIGNCCVASQHLHVAHLTLAEILERSVSPALISQSWPVE